MAEPMTTTPTSHPAALPVSSASADITAAGGGLHGSIGSLPLARLLVRLKWTLWKRSFRKNIGKLIGTIFGALYGAGGLLWLAIVVGGAGFAGGQSALFPALVQGLGTLAVLLWLLIPLFAFGIDDTLDPRRFALFPRTAKELQPGLLAAAALSLPTLFMVLGTAIVTVSEAVWMIALGTSALGVILALVVLIPADLAGIVLCLLLPRAVLAHSAVRTSSRRRRELGGILAIVVLLGVVYGGNLLVASLAGADADVLIAWALRAVEIGAWTPLGALFAAPIDLAQGQLLTGLVRLLIGAATIAIIWRWWRRSIDLAMRSALVGDASSGQTAVSPLVPRFVKPTAFGAVMGRALRYWRRDSRYMTSLAIMPVMLLFFVGMSIIVPDSSGMGITGLLLIAGISGITLMNEIGFDGPAGWVNLTAGLDPRPNLRGRIAALAVLIVPLVTVFAIVIPLLTGQSHLIPVTLLGSLGLMLGGWGTSSVIGALLPYPTSEPGTNPMKDRSASTAAAMLSMGAGMAALIIPQLPAAGIAIWGAVTGSQQILLAGAAVAFVVGIVLLVVGVRVAERILARRYVDVFQKVRAFI